MLTMARLPQYPQIDDWAAVEIADHQPQPLIPGACQVEKHNRRAHA